MNSFVRSTLLVVVAAFTVAACQTTDAYTGEKKVNNASKGAGIGALAGAVLGAATGDNSKERRERALIGAGVGALTGAGVGAYMDKQEAKLRAQLQGTGVSVTRAGNDLILNMPGNITFKTASADLNSGFFRVLDSVSLVLKEYDKTLIDIEVLAHDLRRKFRRRQRVDVAVAPCSDDVGEHAARHALGVDDHILHAYVLQSGLAHQCPRAPTDARVRAGAL